MPVQIDQYHQYHGFWWPGSLGRLGPIPQTICARSTQIQSCYTDRPIVFHKRGLRSASDREITIPSTSLPNDSWYKSFIGTFRTEITRSRLNEKRQTDINLWRHNGRSISPTWNRKIIGVRKLAHLFSQFLVYTFHAYACVYKTETTMSWKHV